MKSSLAKQIIISEIFEINTAFIQFGETHIDMQIVKLCTALIEEGVKIDDEQEFERFLGTLYFYPKTKKYLIPYNNKINSTAQWSVMNIELENISLKKMD
jgi:hypothetical protein